MEFSFEIVKAGETKHLHQISQWIFEEWGMPHEKSLERFGKMDPADIVFHFAMLLNGEIIGTGGLHINVGLYREHERFIGTGPWVGILIVDKKHRGKGYGKILLDAIEAESKKRGFTKLYLYTSTAESLYARNGWKTTERVMYKGGENAVMEKVISNL